jgi:cytochrome c-type biogenesis protein CcmH/NrfF
MNLTRFFLSNCFFLLLLLASSSYAQEFSEEILVKTQEISDSIMSPYCPGRTLSACPSEKARALRVEISTFLERGYSKDAVIRQLKGMFGNTIQASPEPSGFGIIAWSAPFFIITCIGFGLLILLMVLKTKAGTSQVKASETLENELDLEIQKRFKQNKEDR